MQDCTFEVNKQGFVQKRICSELVMPDFDNAILNAANRYRYANSQ